MGKKIILNTCITIMLFISFIMFLFSFEARNWVNVSIAAIAFVVFMAIKIMYVKNVHRELKGK
ncbi:hypothetical protein C3K47_00590 [Solitalea longa]|uniref:Uncharacterized protein n=1 Tax=Solitalea longa TaxID=2079460 RepID=A0A2S5A8W4_9SPHI|nr:DUF6358 family protein [Solitalea longa]POY39031.1 hypothetical protein C3K47_00590 [Solitalea longa]